MPLRQNRSRKDRWFLPLSNPYTLMGYCFERHDLAYMYIRINSTRPRIRKCLNMPWKSHSKPIALDMLKNQIITELTPEQKTVEENDLQWLMVEYLKTHSSSLNKARKSQYIRAIKSLIVNNILLTDASAIRDEVLKNMRDSGLHQNTLRNHYKVLRKIFDYAVDWEYMLRNPLPVSLMPKEIRETPVTLKKGNKERIIQYFKDEAVRLRDASYDNPIQRNANRSKAGTMEEMADLVEFIGITGSRITETLQLTWSRVDKTKIKILGKGKKEREFPIKPLPKLVALLDRLRKRNKGEHLFSWRHSQKPTEKLKTSIKALGIETNNHNGFHLIRKTMINEMVQNPSIPIVTVAELVGHSIPTMQHYYLAHYGAEKTAEILEDAGIGK